MKTKTLFFSILAALFFNPVAKAATYHYCGTGLVTSTSSWWVNSNCSGGHPSGFTGINTWNFVGGISYSLGGNFSVGGGSTVNIGTAALSATVTTNGFSIKRGSGSGNVTLNVNPTGKLIVTTSNLFAGGNFLVLGTCSSGSNVTYNLVGATVGAGTYDNLTISANASLSGNAITVSNVFTNSAILTMSGGYLGIAATMAGAGTISGDANSTFNFTGAGTETLNMDQTTPGSTNVLYSVQNNSTGVLQLGNALEITPGGDCTPVTGNINAGAALLTLQASKGQSGAIGNSGGGGSILGTINSGAYHDPNGNSTNWTTMGSAGLTDATFAMWETSFPITCPSCAATTAGGVPFTSVYSYDETATGGGDYSNGAHYIDLTGDNATINNGQGYWVYMGNSSPGTGTGPEATMVTGTPQQGAVPIGFTFTNASNGYNLLANPYPSPISWSALMTNNPGVSIDGTCYIYNAADGSYGTIDAAGIASGSYGLNDDVVPTGMAFYVLASASGTLTFDESIKSVGGTQDLQRMAHASTQSQISQIPRFSIQATDGVSRGQTMFAFDSKAVIGLDQKVDAVFFPGTEPIKVTSIVAGKDLSINGLPDLTQNYSIPVKMTVTSTGTYSVNGINLNRMPAGACLILHDNYTSTDYDLRNGPYSLTLNDTETVARFVLNITIVPATLSAQTYQATCPAGSNAYITAIGTSAGPWNYTWKNANNVIVRTSLNKASADTLAGLSSGMYVVDVNTVGTCDNASQTFTLTLPAPVSSAFSVSSNTVIVNNSLNFTDNSVNADAWSWDFGDTTYSTLPSPVHTYTTPGTYDVVLYSINTTCGDTAFSFKSIDVLATTGIAINATDEIFVSKDASGAFVKFNYSTETKVGVTVYNALGQVLFNNSATKVSKDKMYLNLDNARGQMVFISVTDQERNTQVTKKLFNE